MTRNTRASSSCFTKLVVALLWLVALSARPWQVEAVQSRGSDRARQESSSRPHVELPAPGDEACALCHEEIAKAAFVHQPVAAGLCTTCHEFSGSGDDTQVAPTLGGWDDVAPLCVGCHTEVGDQLTRGRAHAPATRSCVMCHDPHGSPNAAFLREPVNTLCRACHGAAASDSSLDGSGPPRLFGRPVPMSERDALSGRAIHLDALGRVGHPVTGHPISGPRDPADPSRPFTCVSCHVPHGSNAASLKRFGGGNPTEFCVRCH